MTDLQVFPDLRPIRGGEELRYLSENAPQGAQAMAVEFRVGIVQEIDGPTARRLEDASGGGEEGKSQGLTLPGGGHPSNSMAVPEDPQLIAVGPQEGPLSPPFPFLRLLQSAVDRFRPLQTYGWRRTLAQVDGGEAQFTGTDHLGEGAL